MVSSPTSVLVALVLVLVFVGLVLVFVGLVLVAFQSLLTPSQYDDEIAYFTVR